jgi:hypothetical protein
MPELIELQDGDQGEIGGVYARRWGEMAFGMPGWRAYTILKDGSTKVVPRRVFKRQGYWFPGERDSKMSKFTQSAKRGFGFGNIPRNVSRLFSRKNTNKTKKTKKTTRKTTRAKKSKRSQKSKKTHKKTHKKSKA